MIVFPLNAFLMLRAQAGNWNVSAHRDLGSVMETWDSRSGRDDCVGVLHVGFARLPPEAFEEMSVQFPKRILLTASAKHALPSSFLTSKEAVGVVNGRSIFVGLTGWGYSLDDFTDSDTAPEELTSDPDTDVTTEWLMQFIRKNVELQKLLSSCGIYNDKTYILNESNLPPGIRRNLAVYRIQYLNGMLPADPCRFASYAPPWILDREIGTLGFPIRVERVFRRIGINTVKNLASWSSIELLKERNFGERSLRDAFEALMGALNEGPVQRRGVDKIDEMIADPYDIDPCKLAGLCPAWIADSDIGKLRLPVRARNVFSWIGINRVGDLAKYSSSELLRQRNFGRQSLRDTFRALKAYILEVPFQNDDSGESTGLDIVQGHETDIAQDPRTLLQDVEQALNSLPVRDREILSRRLAFGIQRHTLQELADSYGMTREGVRQVIARACSVWIDRVDLPSTLVLKVRQLIADRQSPLPVASLENLDMWFEGVSSRIEFLFEFVGLMCKGQIYLLDIGGIFYFGLIDQAKWESIVAEAKDLLSSLAEEDLSESHARLIVSELLPENGMEFEPILWEHAIQLCFFSVGRDGESRLTAYGRGAEAVVRAVLGASNRPLHYSEIVERAYRDIGRNLMPRRAHSAAANVGHLFAPGTFGLTRHIPLTDEEMSEICIAAEKLIYFSGQVKQWHTYEILVELSERPTGNHKSLDKYLLEIALARSNILKSLGKMTWTIARDDVDSERRISINQAVIELVEAAGRPLSTAEIRDRLTATRGVNDTFSISPMGPLIRVGPALWGLRDRDANLLTEE